MLAALGLAERRAVRMAAERETLREERDAIAEALAFVKEDEDALLEHGTGGLPSRSVGRGGEELRDGDGDKLSRRRESIRDPGSGIRDRTPGGGGVGKRTEPRTRIERHG